MLVKERLKWQRLQQVFALLALHGFQDIVARITQGLFKTPSADPIPDANTWTRLRMILEALGPTFVKLGQTFSNRDDLLPKTLVLELQQLQDKVKQDPLDVYALLENQLGTERLYELLPMDDKPLASASIAQVYKAILKDGTQVVLKCKRPGIDKTIQADLLLMKDLAALLCQYFDFARNIQLEQAIAVFEKSLLGELSLVQERANMERMANQFAGHPHFYVPKVFPRYSTDEVLCMEFIDGAKITDIDFLAKHHIDAEILAERGLHIYLTQILDHGFFHADPHAGNLMVTPSGQLVMIDLGAMGVLFPKEREQLESVIVCIITKNVPRLVTLLKAMAVQMEVAHQSKLEEDLNNILEMVDQSNLQELDMVALLDKFKQVLFENKILMPEYFTLLARGLLLIESVGRTIYPQLNVFKTVEPFVLRILARKFDPRQWIKQGWEGAQDVAQIPGELRQVLRQLESGTLTVVTKNPNAITHQQWQQHSQVNMVIAILLAGNSIASAIALFATHTWTLWGIPLLAWLGFIISSVLTLVLLLRLLRKTDH